MIRKSSFLLLAVAATLAACATPAKTDIPIDSQGPPRTAPEPQQVDVPDASARAQARGIYVKGLDLFDRRDWAQAEKEFLRALVVDPEYYQAWNKIGVCRYERQKYDGEIEAYRRCLEIAPGFDDARLNLAHALVVMDLLDEAVKNYRIFLDHNPKHPIALFNVGLIYYDLRKFDLSFQFLGKFLDLYPQDALAPKAKHHRDRAKARLDGVPEEGNTTPPTPPK